MSNLISETCQICGKENPENKHFWGEHSIKMQDYYEKFFPKVDLFNGDKIDFKSRDSYFLNDFKNKKNLKCYVEKLTNEEFYTFYKDLLTKRKEYKGIKYIPSQFESRGLLIPPTHYVIRRLSHEGFYRLIKETSIDTRYSYFEDLQIDNLKQFEIITDTREQMRLKFEQPTEIAKLNVGDYAPNPNLDNIFVERKSLSDYCGTFGRGFDRFTKELERAKKNDSYLFIVIEEDFTALQNIENDPKTKMVEASSEFLFHQCRELYKNFDNFQILCCSSRDYARDIIDCIFRVQKPQRFDWQFLIDKKAIHKEGIG